MDETEIAWDDAVHGRISFQGRDLDDFVILRSDNSAIYNLAVVSDDIAMEITHVIRGDDHISNTPKQIALYRALSKEPPVFAHVPMILGSDGKKLSKRHGATAVGDYQDQGILPAAMRNFLALLGWSPGEDREILSRERDGSALLSGGDPEEARGVRHHQARVDEWAVSLGLAGRELEAAGAPAAGADGHPQPIGTLRPLIDSVKARSRTILHVAEQVAVRLDPSRSSSTPRERPYAGRWERTLKETWRWPDKRWSQLSPNDWTPERILTTLKTVAEDHRLKLGDVMQPVRVALTGSTVSEPVNELLFVVGRERSIHTLKTAPRPLAIELQRAMRPSAGHTALAFVVAVSAARRHRPPTVATALCGTSRHPGPSTFPLIEPSPVSLPPPPATVRLAFVGDINLGTSLFPTEYRPTVERVC